MSYEPGLAPVPISRRTADPLWQKLWAAYEPVITPLRRIPLVTDIETSSAAFAITAELVDGSQLQIFLARELPIDPTELEGFCVKRDRVDPPAFIDEIIYDSTEHGEQSKHGNNIVPLVKAVTAYVTQRHLAPRLTDLVFVELQTVSGRRRPLTKALDGPLHDRQEAVREYGYQADLLKQNGWRRVHEQGGDDWPLTVWVRNDEIATLYLAYAGPEHALLSPQGEVPTGPSGEAGQRPCYCVIAHAQNDHERDAVQAALDDALRTNDAHGVLLACMRLLQPCPARSEGVVTR